MLFFLGGISFHRFHIQSDDTARRWYLSTRGNTKPQLNPVRPGFNLTGLNLTRVQVWKSPDSSFKVSSRDSARNIPAETGRVQPLQRPNLLQPQTFSPCKTPLGSLCIRRRFRRWAMDTFRMSTPNRTRLLMLLTDLISEFSLHIQSSLCTNLSGLFLRCC